MTDNLTDITAGNPDRARVLRAHLEHLADGPNPTLREMARAVLNGELTLRHAANSDTYSTALADAFNPFWTRYQGMSPEERDQLAALGQDHLYSSRPS